MRSLAWEVMLADVPPLDRVRYQTALNHALTVAAEKEAMRERFERTRDDTRVETRIWKLTQFNEYLDRLHQSYCATSELLGLSIAPADLWPRLDVDAMNQGDEVTALVLLVSMKHERLQRMPLATVLDNLLLNGGGTVH